MITSYWIQPQQMRDRQESFAENEANNDNLCSNGNSINKIHVAICALLAQSHKCKEKSTGIDKLPKQQSQQNYASN